MGLIKDKIGENNRENSLIKSSFDGFFLYYGESNLEEYSVAAEIFLEINLTFLVDLFIPYFKLLYQDGKGLEFLLDI